VRVSAERLALDSIKELLLCMSLKRFVIMLYSLVKPLLTFIRPLTILPDDLWNTLHFCRFILASAILLWVTKS
jgi:hypothetical protein